MEWSNHPKSNPVAEICYHGAFSWQKQIIRKEVKCIIFSPHPSRFQHTHWKLFQSNEVWLCSKTILLFNKCSLPPFPVAFYVKFQLLSLSQKASCNLTTGYVLRITSCHSPTIPLFFSHTRLFAIPSVWHALPSFCAPFKSSVSRMHFLYFTVNSEYKSNTISSRKPSLMFACPPLPEQFGHTSDIAMITFYYIYWSPVL